MTRLVLGFILAAPAFCGVVQDVRAALRNQDQPRAKMLLEQFKKQNGVDGEYLEAYSWLARDALARKDVTAAEKYAADTKRSVAVLLKARALDAEPHLPLALGNAIEVEANAAVQKGERDQAVAYLRGELNRYSKTSIRTRIQKNIHLLSLEGKPAPALETKEWIGPKAAVIPKGKPALLFFWAHWCSDCKKQMPILAELRKQYASRGLVVVGPTQRYGYAEGGREVGPEEEKKYIESVRNSFYGPLDDIPVPLSEETFKLYGVSTTPTLVLLDRNGIVRLYHPGNLSGEELRVALDRLL